MWHRNGRRTSCKFWTMFEDAHKTVKRARLTRRLFFHFHRYSRDWRWHKKLQQWMMKAKEFGEPQPLPSQKEERGYYYFFDVNNWRRERVSLLLLRCIALRGGGGRGARRCC